MMNHADLAQMVGDNDNKRGKQTYTKIPEPYRTTIIIARTARRNHNTKKSQHRNNNNKHMTKYI